MTTKAPDTFAALRLDYVELWRRHRAGELTTAETVTARQALQARLAALHPTRKPKETT